MKSSRNLEPATTAAIRLSRAFMNIADAAAPSLHRLIEDFSHFAGRVERMTENRGALESLFQFGEMQLHAWLRLAKAVGQTIAAIMGPGGDLSRGASASGLRILRDFTLDFRRAAEWINSHPLEVDKFFKDSEESMHRILDLLIEIGKVLFRLFDPDSIDAFADIVEAMLPAFEQIAETFGFISKVLAEILQNPVARLIFQTGFGLLVFQRIGSKFIGLFSSIGAAALGVGTTLLTWQQRIGRSAAALSAMSTATGGLSARISAATAAWQGYTAAAGRAAAATTGTTVLPAGRGAGGVYRDPRTGRQTLPPGVRGGGAPAVVAGGGAVGRGLGRAGALAAGAARFLGPLAAVLGGFAAVTAGSGGEFGAQTSLSERIGAGVSAATLGIIPGPRTTDDRTKKILEGIRDFKGIVTMKDITKEWDDFNDEQQRTIRQAQILHNNAVRVKDAFDRMFPREGIVNRAEFNQALDRIKDFRESSIDNLKQLRDNMRITFTFIGDSAKKGSDAWRVAMVQNTQAGVENIIEAANNGKIKWRDAMEEITRITRRQMRLVRGHVTDLSADARDALSENFRTARIRAERQLGNLETATGQSLRTIKRLVATELASYGFTASQVRSIIRARRDEDDIHSRGSRSFEGGSNSVDLGQAEGGWARRPMGGFVGAMGERGQDAIRTMLGRGEAVLNWGQQRLVEPALNAAYGFGLDELFRRSKGMHAGVKTVGYARGGRIPIVPVPGFPGEMANRAILDEIAFVTKKFGLRLTDAYGQGHQSPGHTIYGTAADFSGPDRAMNAAVRFLASKYKVLYDGRFGSTAWPGHGPSTVAGSNAHLHVEFGTKDLGVAAGNLAAFRIPRVEVVGAGAVGDIANAAVQSARRGAIRAARRAINRSLGAGVEGAEMGHGAAPPGQLRSWLRRALQITGHLSPGNLSALYGRAMQESGGDPRAINNWDSNAAAGNNSRGLLQTIPSTFAAYSLPGMKNIYNPIHNAVAAIRYMFARYGHVVGPSSTGYAAGGELPGPLGMAQSIIAHGKEWIVNERQKGRLAALTGMSVGRLKSALGFTGGPTSFAGGGEVDRSFDLPDFLPQTPGGTIGLLRRLFTFVRKFGNVNKNLDIATREGGLFDQFTSNLEDFTSKLEASVTRGIFKLRRGRAVRRQGRDDVWVSQQTLDNLEETGSLLQRLDNQINRGLARVITAIRRIRRGGVDEDERGDLLDLRGQRRNLRGRRDVISGLIGENLQSRFDQQQAVRDAIRERLSGRIERSDTRFGRRLTALDLQERIFAATGAIGLGSRTSVLSGRNAVLGEQIAALTDFRNRAAGRGLTDIVDELNDRIAELNVTMQENTRALFDARVEEVNRQQQLVGAATGARSRIAELQGQLGLISSDDARARMREQAQIALSALQTQGSGLSQLLGEAQAAGDQQRIEELQQAILDNTVAQLEATVTLKDLEGTLTQTQSFSSTAWQWFRTAIFNGSGGLLPQFSPSMGLGGIPIPMPTGTWGAGGGGEGFAQTQKVVGVEHMEITQNETVDYVALGNKIAWDINTPTT